MVDGLVLTAAFLTGLAGSVHCAAMCGGIATGLSLAQRGGWWKAVQPNLGRVAGYALAGAAVGAFGTGLLAVVDAPALGMAMRALVGVILILAALRMLDTRGRLGALATPGRRLWQALKPLQRPLLPADTLPKRLALGVLWGWMPCGLSATLLVAAWLQADPLHGALTMTAFGLGTLPLMLPLTWAGHRIVALQQGRWRTVAAGVVLVAGIATLTAPWLGHAPAVHGALAALGCRSVPG